MKLLSLIVVGGLLAECSPAFPAPQLVTPETLGARLAAAKPGETVVLDPKGRFGDVTLPPRDHAKPVQIVATGATLRSLTVRNTAGWRWKGGTIDSPLPPAVWRNVMIDNARRIEIAGVTLTGGHTGVVVTRGSDDITLRDNIATGLESDGFNVATATRVNLIGNVCRDFRPIPPVFDGARMVKDGTHPDCIMLWSEAGQPPTSDILIAGNRAEGAMQGIAHFWHPNLGRDKVYRVTARDNIVDVSYYHGIMLEDTPGSVVEGNTVSTVRNATAAGRPGEKVRAWLKSDPDATRCGNRVNGSDERPCRSRRETIPAR